MAKDIRIHPYIKVLEPFSSEEVTRITQLKRFFEWSQGDPEFRRSVESGIFSPEHLDRLRRIGVHFDPYEVALLWKKPEVFAQFVGELFRNGQHELSDELIDALTHYPLLKLWGRFVLRKNTIYRELRKTIARTPRNPQFDAWRLRRIAAVRSELGFFGHYIDHPILAFELGDGCSVGCWFCAFAARKLTKNFDYSDNREFFRQIVQTCVDLFGRSGASLALLYYGTEPHDNPHYLDFIKDYAEITGKPVCTSTAAPTDATWLRELIAYYHQGPYPWPRLSVLSKAMLLKIHDLYSPEELRDVDLLMQMKDHPRKKVAGGRILEEQSGLRGREEGHYLDDIVPQGSISCISGFLVNMVNQTFQLVSPCYTNKQWPYGYRVFDETSFEDAEDFRHAIESLIERNMPNTPFLDRPARFRDDLVYRPMDDGFDLVSPNQVHHFRGKTIYGPLGSLIAEGGLTYDELHDVVMDTYRLNPMAVIAVVQKLFNGGFLDEVNPACSSVYES